MNAPAADLAPPPPPPSPPTTDRRSPTDADRAHARWTVAMLVIAGVCVDLVLRSRLDGAAASASVAAAALAIVVGARTVSRQAHAVLVLAVAIGASLSLRSSPWLVPLDVVAAGGLLVAGALLSREGDLRDLDVTRFVQRASRLVVAPFHGPAFVLDRLATLVPAPDDAARERLRGAARGVGLALPVVLVVGLLLASADAVFASFFDVPLDLGRFTSHVAGIVLGAWMASAVVWLAVDRWAPRPVVAPRLGTIEGTVVLAGLVGTYGLFVVAQVVATGAGEAHILATTGLTRAEYARSGFFQLLWAAGLTVGVLLALHAALGRPAERAVRVRIAVLDALAVGLTLVVVGVAIRRLGLYDEAFGLTMLRLYSTIFAWWLGAVLILVGAYVLLPPRRRWLAAAIAASALAVLGVVNVADPERLVVEHNLARLAEGHEIDVDHLVGLSDDAVPALVDGLDRLGPDDRRQVTAILCSRAARREAVAWYGANRARAAADEALDGLCAPGA